MRRRPGRSFALLVGMGAVLEFGGAAIAYAGIQTMAQCYYWTWFPGVGQGHFPAACMQPLAGAGFHLFVPVALLLGVLCASAILAGVRAVGLVRSARNADLVLGPCLSELPEALTDAVAQVGGERVELRGDAEPYALCIGVLRPRIAVSTGLVQVLGRDELAAVLAHEELHRRRRAPLRQIAARVIARGLFFVPLLDDLLEVHVVEEEILADRKSAATVGRRPLAAALGKLLSTPSMAAGTSGFGRTSALPYRVKALGEDRMPLPKLGLPRVVASGATLGALVLLMLWMPISGLH